MTDPAYTDPLVAGTKEDRTMPLVCYVIYLLSIPLAGITVVIGLILAYLNRDGAGPRMRSHYTFLIDTFWKSLLWVLIGWALLIFGVPLSFILVGVPLVVLGAAILALVGLWFAVRCVVGLVRLSNGEAYPNPRTWLI